MLSKAQPGLQLQTPVHTIKEIPTAEQQQQQQRQQLVQIGSSSSSGRS
jgi:hypothetical protein